MDVKLQVLYEVKAVLDKDNDYICYILHNLRRRSFWWQYGYRKAIDEVVAQVQAYLGRESSFNTLAITQGYRADWCEAGARLRLEWLDRAINAEECYDFI